MIPQTQPATPTLPITTAKGVLQNTVITLKSISETGQLSSTQQRPAGEKTKKNINYKTLVFYQLLLVKEPLNVADSMIRLFKDCSEYLFANIVVLHVATPTLVSRNPAREPRNKLLFCEGNKISKA